MRLLLLAADFFFSRGEAESGHEASKELSLLPTPFLWPEALFVSGRSAPVTVPAALFPLSFKVGFVNAVHSAVC